MKSIRSIFAKKTPRRTAKNSGISELLAETKSDLDSARENLNRETDTTLIDMYIYRIKAAEARHRHLLKIAKRNG